MLGLVNRSFLIPYLSLILLPFYILFIYFCFFFLVVVWGGGGLCCWHVCLCSHDIVSLCSMLI